MIELWLSDLGSKLLLAEPSRGCKIIILRQSITFWNAQTLEICLSIVGLLLLLCNYRLSVDPCELTMLYKSFCLIENEYK